MDNFTSRISLKNKYILVTGACGLIGTQICRAIAEFEGDLLLADINADKCSSFAKQLKEDYKVEAVPLIIDINSEESVESVIKYLGEKSIEVFGLVNCAYPRNKTYGSKYEDITLESWKENVDLHLNGYFNITQKISRIMTKQDKGSIVNIASIYGILGPDFKIYEGTAMTMPAEYAAIKGAIVNFTRYLATYLAGYNIRVNTVSPGGIFDHQPEQFVNNYNSKVPMGRMGRPDEIAGGVVFLLSDMASYITGHNLIIDGGWSTW